MRGVFVVFLFISAFGCVLVPERLVVVEPVPEIKAVPSLPSDFIDEKIRSLSETLEKKGLPDKDKEIASNLLEAFKSVKMALSTQLSEEQYSRVLRSILQYLTLIDEYYFSKELGEKQDYSGPITLFIKKRNKILDAYLSGDSKGVIDDCLELKRVFGPDALTPEIALVFALSLGKEGMLEEATNIGEGIAHEREARPDLVQLRAGVVELLLKRGELEKATSTYEKLADTVDRQQAVIQSLSTKITTTRTTGPEPEGVNKPEKQLHTMTGKGEDAPEQLIEKVKELVQEHRFGEARNLLGLKTSEGQAGLGIGVVDQVLNIIEQAEEKYLEDRVSMISRTRETLELARKLLEEEKFEEAISSLDALQVDQEESREIREFKEQATEKLINRERNRAAKIFLAAKKTQDPTEKEKLLLSSYKILNTLIEQYPSSPLNNKIKSHMDRVMEELDKVRKGSQ